MGIALNPILPQPQASKPAARWNLVTFTPDPPDSGTSSESAMVPIVSDGGGANGKIFLKLDEAWTRKAGIQPDTNRAVLSYKEFARFGGNADRSGTIEFWYTSDPLKGGRADVTLRSERVVAIGSAGQGETPDQGVTTYEYEIFFNDFRERWVSPRGGRLEFGIFNSGPKLPYQSFDFAPDVTADLAGVPPEVPAELNAPMVPELSLRDLINLCLGQMGLAGLHLPNEVDGADAPRDIKWFGNHAPTELAKLLALVGCVFCPQLDGTPTIEAMTAVGDVTFPAGEQLPTQSIPKVDRRGKTVVFSSYPRAVIQTQTDAGPPASSAQNPNANFWDFVAQDSHANWRQLIQCDLVLNAVAKYGARGMAGVIADDFVAVDPKFRDRVRSQVFRCIQRSQSPLNAGNAPVLARRFEGDLKDYPILVQARIPVKDVNGLWSNSPDPVNVAVLLRSDEDVLHLDKPLVLLAEPTIRPNEHIAHFSPFTVRYSYEDAEALPVAVGGKNQVMYFPLYYHVGFSAGGPGGAPLQLADADVENAIDGNLRDAIILTRPQWRLITVDGREINRDELDAKASREAAKFLKDASAPDRVCASRGFSPVAPSGLVTEVKWDQQKVMTTAKLCDWYSPLGALDENHELRKLERDGYPNQAETDTSRTSLGESGSTQPVLPIEPPSREPAAEGEVDIQLTGWCGSEGGGMFGAGTYFGPIVQGRVAGRDVNATDLDLPDKGESLPSATVYFENSFENKAPTGTHALATDGTVFVTGHKVGIASDGTAIYRGYAPPPAPQACTLAQSSIGLGGGDNATTATGYATYKYDVTDRLTGNLIEQAVMPVCQRPQGPLTGPAKTGFYLITDGICILLWTDEQPALDACS